MAAFDQQNQQKYFDWLLVTIVFYILLIVHVGIFAVAAAAILHRIKLPKRQLYFLSLLAILWMVPFGLFWSRSEFRYDYLEIWIFATPFAPLISLTFYGAMILKPKSLQEQLIEYENQERRYQSRLAQSATNRRETAVSKAKLRLGSKVKGIKFPEYSGVSIQDGWLMVNENVLDQHIFLLGTTGAGKSETIKRIVFEILKSTDRSVYFVDGKGDQELANDLRSLAFQHGRGLAPVFKLGFSESGAVYDGFRGDVLDIINRLCALIGVSEAEANAQFYADINRTLLRLVCRSPNGVPRSFGQILERLDKDRLLDEYQQNSEKKRLIKMIHEKHYESLLFRLIPLAEDFNQSVGSGGFALEDVRSAIFSMRTQSVGDTAKRFLDFLVEDLKDFIGKRQTHPSILIIDEFGTFSNKNITNLLSLARSSKMAVILATQDVASLGDEQTKQLILANTRTKILMATDFPEELSELAGTILRLEHSIQHQEGDATGLGSSRVQHQFAVDPNEVARLQPGEAFVIRQRHHAKIKVKAIGKVNHIAPQEEEKREQASAKEKDIDSNSENALGLEDLN